MRRDRMAFVASFSKAAVADEARVSAAGDDETEYYGMTRASAFFREVDGLASA